MAGFIKVVEFHTRQVIRIPLKPNGNLGLGTLSTQFPGSYGLLYFNKKTKSMEKIPCIGEEYPPPGDVWPDGLYFCMYPKSESQVWFVLICLVFFYHMYTDGRD